MTIKEIRIKIRHNNISLIGRVLAYHGRGIPSFKVRLDSPFQCDGRGASYGFASAMSGDYMCKQNGQLTTRARKLAEGFLIEAYEGALRSKND